MKKQRMNSVLKNNSRVVILAVVLVVGGGFFVLNQGGESNMAQQGSESQAKNVPAALRNSGINTDFSKTSVDLGKILSGGPRKDGIPALTDPKFVALSESKVKDNVQVMYVQNNGEEKLYQYSILVWHEIINDSVGGKPLAITFCPLCGSAIVYDRKVGDETLDFGVSGLLIDSNMVMYSREDQESLWQQSLGEAIVGQRLGTKLTVFPVKVTTFGEAKAKYPNSTIVSTNTGASRDYQSTPYSGYGDSEQTYFPVAVTDKRFPAKEIFYIIPLEGNSIAVRQTKPDGIYDVPDTDIKVTLDKGEIIAKWGTEELPGYYEMWFSWANNHQDNGIILD